MAQYPRLKSAATDADFDGGHTPATARASMTQLLTPRQASEYLQVPVSTLAVWRCTDRVHLPFVKVGGRHVRYRREDLEAFLASPSTQKGTPKAAPAPGVRVSDVVAEMFKLRPCEQCGLAFPSTVLSTHHSGGKSSELCPACHRKAHQAKGRRFTQQSAVPLRTPKTADRPHASEEPSQRRKPGRAS
jgi:excisionase family DNA binding protein